MFKKIKLYFTNRSYYEQQKRYLKRQKAVRKTLKKLAKNFCPWSGYYMHEMIKTMLEFYHETYEARDCCWGDEETEIKPITNSLSMALYWATELDNIDNFTDEELLKIINNSTAFEKYVSTWEAKADRKADNNKLKAALAYEFLTEKYTRAMYNVIGKHIWEWRD